MACGPHQGRGADAPPRTVLLGGPVSPMGDSEGLGPGRWWQSGVIYQVYPRSFADADEDGVGDLVGITSRLDYLEHLGVDAIWLSPIYPSPMVDFGYDVTDHTGVGLVRDPRALRWPRRRGPPARPAGPGRLHPEPHQRPAPVVRRGVFVQAGSPPRLVPVGRPGCRRRAAEQLALGLRGSGMDPAPANGPVLLPRVLA